MEKTFRELSESASKLRDQLMELRLTVVEDKPRSPGGPVVDKLEYAVEELLGWLLELAAAALEAERAVRGPANLDQARRALANSQERYQRMQRCFLASLASYEQLKELDRFSAMRRGEWPAWAKTVKQGIDQCRGPLEEVGRAQAECWQELTEEDVPPVVEG